MKKHLIFILLGVAGVLSLTFASYFVLNQFNPELELRRMLFVMSEVESFHQDSGFSWSRDDDMVRTNTTLYSKGIIELPDESTIDHETTFRVVYFSEGSEYSDISGELKKVKGKNYLTYTPPAPIVPGVDFDSNGTWVSFDPGELPSWGAILPGLRLPIDPITDKNVWTPEGVERLRYLLSIADVFYVDHDDLTELIGGVNTRIVDARIDPDAIRSFLLDFVRAKEGREPTDTERIAVEKQASQIERLTVRMWIGIEDHLLYRFQAAGGFTQEGSTGLVPVDMKIELSKFNDTAGITEPKHPLVFAQILRSFLANLPEASAARSLGSSNMNSLETGNLATLPLQKVEGGDDLDNDGLSNVLEAFYGTNPSNPDTDNDGMSDGDEVRVTRNPRGSGSLFSFGL